MLTGSTVLQANELGRPASAEEIAQWDLTVMPNGEGLPKGSGTALEGEKVYQQYCLACHGQAGSGATADELAGIPIEIDMTYPEKTVGNYWPYATTIFDLIRRSMPMTSPGSLTDNQTYAVTAYLLYLNGIIEQEELMTSESLPKVEMPNRNGFIDVYSTEKGNK